LGASDGARDDNVNDDHAKDDNAKDDNDQVGARTQRIASARRRFSGSKFHNRLSICGVDGLGLPRL
jgi:hypothetical protein